MPKYPFPHTGPVYTVLSDTHEIVYYAREGKKFRRIRRVNEPDWDYTTEQEVDNDTFWMVIACVERIH